MVGTAKWKEEWISFIHAAKKNGKTGSEIAAELHVRFPRQGKDFNVGGVKYVLSNYEDPALPNNQVQGGGVKKKKKPTKGSQLSAGMQNAMDHVRMGSPATSVASSFDPDTQTRRLVVGDSMAAGFENPRPLNMLPSASSSAPGHNLRDAVADMNSSYNIPGPHTYSEGSFAGREGHQYAASTPGTSNYNPRTIDNDDHGVAHQSMHRSSTNRQNNIAGHGQEQHAINPYTMNNPAFVQHMHQKYAQPLNGQVQAATNNPMAQFMSGQTQQVIGGFHNGARVGLGQGAALNPHSSVMQNIYAQLQKGNPPQGPPQVQQPSNGLPTTTDFSNNPNLAINTARTAVSNHGLPNYPKNVSGSNGYTHSNQPGSHQDMIGEQDLHSMMRNVNGMENMGNSTTRAVTSSRQHATPKKSAGAQNTQNHSSSKTRRPKDAFDFDEEETFFDPELLSLVPPPLAKSASASRTEPQNQVGMGIAATQTGAKRKSQEEEPARTQMSSVGGPSNTMNPHKRQKQDSPDATMMAGSGGQVNSATVIQRPSMQGNVRNSGNTRRTPQKHIMQSSRGTPHKPHFTSNSQPRPQFVENPAASATNVQAAMANPSSGLVYNPILLQQYQRDHGGRTPEEEIRRLKLNYQALSNSQNGRLDAQQLQQMQGYYESIKQDANSLLQNYPRVTPPNLNPLQRSDGQTEETSCSGMPQSTLSLEEQQEHYKILKEKLAQGNNRDVSRAPMGQTGTSQRVSQQQLSQPNIGNNNMSNSSSNRQASSNTNSASVPPTYQAAPNMNRADISTSQIAQVNGHRFNAPPIPRPTPNMSQAAISTSHQGQPSGNGTGVVLDSHLSTKTNKAMPGTHRTHVTQNGVNHVQDPAGHPPKPNVGRPNTAPTPATHHVPNTTYGDNLMQPNTHLQASAPMQKSTSLPPPNSRPSPSVVSRASVNMQPPPAHQVQDQSRNQGVKVSANQQAAVNASRSSTPSIANGPYQSPYPSNAGIGPQNAPAQPQMRDQPLHQAVDGAVSGGISAPAQNLRVKSPSASSKSGTASDQTSSAATVSPNSAASNGAPSGVDGLLMINLENAIFYDHFTFPATRDGWDLVLDHFNNEHHLTSGDKGTVILLRQPQFFGGVSWPTGQEPPNQGTPLPLSVSHDLQPFVAQAAGPLAPSNQNTAVSNPVSSDGPSFVPQPTGLSQPVRQAPIAPRVTNCNLPKPVPSAKVDRKKPELHINLDNVSPKTAMRKAGPIQNQTEQGFPELLVEEGDDLGGLFGDGDDLGLSGDGDDLFGEGPDDNQNVSGPSASAHSGDQISGPSLGLTLSSPAAGTTQQGGENTQSFLDNAQPASRESSAPKSILQHPNQSSAEASSRHVHFGGPEVDVPKPEDDILTDVNAAEWRARHPIPKMPFWQTKKKTPPPPPPPEEPEENDYDGPEEPKDPEWMTDTSPEGVAWNILMQKWWLGSVFPDYPKLDRLDVTGLNRPKGPLTWDILLDQNYTYRWDVSDYINAVGHEDWDARGNPEVQAALDMLQYIERWGELCTKFDQNGKPMMAEAPDPSRKEFNERMADEIYQEKKARREAWEIEQARLEALEEEKKAEEQKARRKALEEKRATLEKERREAVEKERAADEEEAEKSRPTMSFMEKLALENKEDLEFW
ncbi:hypothetical protein DL95DRAFT_413916 [Leptodontidium sp. 2 PMI_412]|nr:hypothetical protein DL95DRAFT_413916 [Leptodontidium sp. 2 PMI_412]